MVTDADVVFLAQRGMAFALNQETEAECLARTRTQIEEIVAREIEARAPEQGGEMREAYPVANEKESALGWSFAYDFLCKISDATRASGEYVCMEGVEAVIRALLTREPAEKQGGEMREAIEWLLEAANRNVGGMVPGVVAGWCCRALALLARESAEPAEERGPALSQDVDLPNGQNGKEPL